MSTAGQLANDATIYKRMPIWVECALGNLPAIARCHTVDTLAGIFPGLPAINVAPGPSLDRNVEQLRAVKGHAVIIALAHAMPRLTRDGITPDVVICCESIDQSMYLEGADWDGISLLALVAQSNPAMYQLPARRIVTYTSNISTEWLEHAISRDCSLIAGNTTASVAWGLATLMGCKPVALVGHDLTWDGDKRYADGITGIGTIDQGVQATGHDGQPTLTSLTFYRQAQWFTARAAEGHRIINATEGGLLIDGTQPAKLADVVTEYARGVTVDPEATIAAAIDSHDTTDQRRTLRRWTHDAVKNLEDADRHAEKVIEEASRLREIGHMLHTMTRSEESLYAALQRSGWLCAVTDPRTANDLQGRARGVSCMLDTFRAMADVAKYTRERAAYLIPRLREAGIAIGRGE